MGNPILPVFGKPRKAPSALGSKHAGSKLSETDVKEIRKLVKNGFTQKQVAEKFNMSCGCIQKIIKRVTWTHVS